MVIRVLHVDYSPDCKISTGMCTVVPHRLSYRMSPLVFLPYELLVEEKGMITMYFDLIHSAERFGIRSAIVQPLGRLFGPAFGSETASDLGPFSIIRIQKRDVVR